MQLKQLLKYHKSTTCVVYEILYKLKQLAHITHFNFHCANRSKVMFSANLFELAKIAIWGFLFCNCNIFVDILRQDSTDTCCFLAKSSNKLQFFFNPLKQSRGARRMSCWNETTEKIRVAFTELRERLLNDAEAIAWAQQKGLVSILSLSKRDSIQQLRIMCVILIVSH